MRWYFLAIPTVIQAQIVLPEVPAFPLNVTNCGFDQTFTTAPMRAVTMNQGATEIMLALGLEGSVVGTAYIDDRIEPRFKAAYDTIPVLSATYPSKDELIAVNADFVYGSYSSAFKPEYAGPRDNVTWGSYVSPASCANVTLRPEVLTIDHVFEEIRDIATIFGIPHIGANVVTELESHLFRVNHNLADIDTQGIKVSWFDSFNAAGVYAGACCGAPAMIMRLLGVDNVFHDKEGNWATVSWDEFITTDPDVIVIVNATWDTAEEKFAKLAEPQFANMTAVKAQSWVTLDFSYTTPNVKNVEAVEFIGNLIEPLKRVAAETSFPLNVTNCGFDQTFKTAPMRAVTMNQGATEIMLALGLEGSMVGTAYIDDRIEPRFKAAYDTIPVLSATYPSKDELIAVNADFVYGSYSSAFKPEYAGPRDNVTWGSYVSPASCANVTLRPEVLTIDHVFEEIRDIATIFGIPHIGANVVTELESHLFRVNHNLADIDTQGIKVSWFDSFNAAGVYAGACCGAPAMIMRLLGVDNVFHDKEGNWATVSWDEFITTDPDVIVIVNATWDTAEEKFAKLAEPQFANMTAVKTQSWVTLDFSYTTPNVKNVEAVEFIGSLIQTENPRELTEIIEDPEQSAVSTTTLILVVGGAILAFFAATFLPLKSIPTIEFFTKTKIESPPDVVVKTNGV